MPVRHRRDKSRRAVTALTFEQESELLNGPTVCPPIGCSRAGHRDVALLAIGGPGVDEADIYVTSAGRPRLQRRPRCSEWATETERAAAWFTHRDELLADELPGNRPWGYWRYEIGVRPVWPPGEAAILAERGLLDAAEEGAILAAADRERRVRGQQPRGRASAIENAADIIRARRGIGRPEVPAAGADG
jgi:hypothetical protein